MPGRAGLPKRPGRSILPPEVGEVENAVVEQAAARLGSHPVFRDPCRGQDLLSDPLSQQRPDHSPAQVSCTSSIHLNP